MTFNHRLIKSSRCSHYLTPKKSQREASSIILTPPIRLQHKKANNIKHQSTHKTFERKKRYYNRHNNCKQKTTMPLPILPPILSSLAPVALFVPPWLLILFISTCLFYFWVTNWPGTNVKVRPIRASAFSADKVPSNLDTIVIGSGSGGSSCSNILAQSGQKVLLLEQHEDRTGGCTHTFRINGCEWDTGLHYTSEGMGLPTHRAGALVKFMSRGKQEWKRL